MISSVTKARLLFLRCFFIKLFTSDEGMFSAGAVTSTRLTGKTAFAEFVSFSATDELAGDIAMVLEVFVGSFAAGTIELPIKSGDGESAGDPDGVLFLLVSASLTIET
jgi:hypothetical protein